MKEIRIQNLGRPLQTPITAGYCASFACRLRGLAWRASLPPNWGLLLVGRRDSRLDAAIHMLGMQIDLAVVWINQEKLVVDVRRAFRWRSFIIPSAPARYVLELEPRHRSDFRIGEQVDFIDV